MTYQARRMDGRVKVPVSVVVGQGNLYLLAIPTDGQITELSISSEVAAQLGKQIEMEREFGMFMGEHGFTDIYQANESYLEMIAKQRKFGFYKGNLTDGVLKRVV